MLLPPLSVGVAALSTLDTVEVCDPNEMDTTSRVSPVSYTHLTLPTICSV